MWKLVVQNILYFMHDLLPAAYSHHNWTIDSVNKAISWGAYCEKAFKQANENGSVSVAFHQLAEKYNWALSFEQLSTARVYLFRYLLQNQLIDRDVHCHIEQKANEILGEGVTKELFHEVKQQIDSIETLMNCFSKSEGKISSRFEMRLLLEAASSLTEEQLQSQFRLVILSSGGLDILLEAVLLGSNDENIDKIQVILGNWLESILLLQRGNSLYRKVISQLSNVSSDLLCKLLVKNPQLHSALLSSMKREALTFYPQYEDGVALWVLPESSTCPLKYKDFINLYITFQSDERLACSTYEKVSNWCFEDGEAIWLDIMGAST